MAPTKIPGLFVGVDELVNRLSEVAVQTTSIAINNEINEIVAELFLLHAGLHRLRHDRHMVDEADVNTFIEMLMHGSN